MAPRKTIPAADIAAALDRLAAAIAARHAQTPSLILLGIANGGVSVCRRLAALVGATRAQPVSEGVLNVSFHRDDIGLNPIPKFAIATSVPADLEDATVVLVDDVLFSGRTVRAALEEVFSHGRPACVELAVLVDRGNRRLPIAPDYTGFAEATEPSERVRVRVSADPGEAAGDTIIITAG